MVIQYITVKYLSDVVTLQNIVYSYLDKKELLETLSVNEFKILLNSQFAVGIFDGEHLIAFRAFLVPSHDMDDHLADDVGIDKEGTIYSEVSLVHPEYRGQQLQTKMGKYLIDDLKRSSDLKYILATVSPNNIPSLKDKFKLGFRILKTKYKYGNKLRHIMMRDLHGESLYEFGKSIHVSYQDTDWMIENGHHYIGTRLENGEIHYYKR
ncbi:GNAT family N-acetyltransferase [Aliicoccus persicus]|uniref:Acetyltransferase (GNAT) family protein n=1 Tax=Aliicoccus persicus TaxID=930138 RepID=A0A662Z236_9STAP|nr:GNAT family N-acetyltransferase [Aliicoccus persicus]SEV87327.1 Acetyltransferase (GNAT) family protein [Aliicoccus persicus]